MRTKVTALLAASAMLLGFLPGSALAAGPIGGGNPGDAPKIDDRMDPLTAAQRKELDRRVAAHRRDPSAATPWPVVRAKLERRRR